ncbi:MAG: 2-dehydropantoate 2-reductase [Clostridiales bacterium]|nr:2-dehydropantoate 2-reductase [Clostridiales bacterium]
MKYLIIGAGGTGGMLGFYLANGHKDVILIARGEHLAAIQKNGLTVNRPWKGTVEKVPVQAVSMEEYHDAPDVIIVCVKYYSLEGIIPFLRKVSGRNTVIIPILNVYGTGGKLQEHLPESVVTDGCIYIAAHIESPGVLTQFSNVKKVVFGNRDHEQDTSMLEDIDRDLRACGIDSVLSPDVQRDCMKKYCYISALNAASLYYDATAGDFSKEGAPRELLIALTKEIFAVAEAMGIVFDTDVLAENLAILSHLTPDAITSMQLDIRKGRPSEIDGLVFEMLRLGEKYHVPVPNYEKVVEKIRGMS